MTTQPQDVVVSLPTATVWLIETGEYADRYVYGVAASVDAAVEFIKGQYPEPYVVDWMPLDGDGGSVTLRGHFSRVQRFSTGHVGEWDITPMAVIG